MNWRRMLAAFGHGLEEAWVWWFNDGRRTLITVVVILLLIPAIRAMVVAQIQALGSALIPSLFLLGFILFCLGKIAGLFPGGRRRH